MGDVVGGGRGLAVGLWVVASLARGQEAAMTRSGHELAVSLSGYTYSEPSVMTLKAQKIGVDYSATHALRPDWPSRGAGWFVRGDLRFAGGKADYDGGAMGTMTDRPDWYLEARGLVGKDFVAGEAVVSPYLGIGYRYLFNDLRGVSTAGLSLYRRESHYYSLPLGITHRIQLASGAVLTSMLEYAPLLRGRQETNLSDQNPLVPSVTNQQRRGYGMRLGALLRLGAWSIGPMVGWWRIAESDGVASLGGTAIEPKNETREAGLRIGYHF